jgi:ribosome maturation factor RimP
MEVAEQVRALVEPNLSAHNVELVDVEHAPGLLRITIDRSGGVDLNAVTEISEDISSLLDNAEFIPEHYTLEVSSPGIERPLRNPEHFQRFVGSQVNVKTRVAYQTPTGKQRRFTGELKSANDTEVVVDDISIPYEDIERARLVVDWSEAFNDTDKPASVKGKS